MKFAAIVLVLFAQVVTADEPAIPRRFSFRFDHRPIWISQRDLFTEGGSVRQGILREHDWEDYEQRRKMKSDGDCDVRFVGYLDGYESNVRTLEELLDLAARRTVISGTVTASDVGLHLAMPPHTVLRIDRERGEAAYVVYPHGRIPIEDMMVCNADPHYADPPPRVGDAVTVLAEEPFEDTGTLYWPAGSSISFERDGVLVAAPYFRDDPAVARFTTLQSITDLLRSRQKSHGR
jgi:hypothetical protein